MDLLHKIWWIIAGAVFLALFVYWAVFFSPQAATAMAVSVLGGTVILGTIFKWIGTRK